MDSKDKQIIRALQEDGRISNLDLAARVSLSPSPCLRRHRLLEKQGVIAGYTALVDAKAYGMQITAYISVKLCEHGQDIVQGFEERIAAIDEIQECYLMTGEADYLLLALVEDLAAYERFTRHNLQTIPGIASINSSFVYGTVKKRRIFP